MATLETYQFREGDAVIDINDQSPRPVRTVVDSQSWQDIVWISNEGGGRYGVESADLGLIMPATARKGLNK